MKFVSCVGFSVFNDLLSLKPKLILWPPLRCNYYAAVRYVEGRIDLGKVQRNRMVFWKGGWAVVLDTDFLSGKSAEEEY